MAPLGSFDHNMIQFHRPKIKRVKARKIKVKEWNMSTTDCLRTYIDCTDWNVFFAVCSGVNELTDTITCYFRTGEDKNILS